jgi:hypothetical protein
LIESRQGTGFLTFVTIAASVGFFNGKHLGDVQYFPRADNGRQGQAAAQPFAEGNDIGGQFFVLETVQFAAASQADFDFVAQNQCSVGLQPILNGFQKTGRRDNQEADKSKSRRPSSSTR